MSPTDRRRPPFDGARTTQFATASGVSVPPLTVWVGSAMYTFPDDRDVIVGRDRDCDICFDDVNPEDLTLISRVHAILRLDGGRWVVVDKSQNGIFADGSRANVIPVRDGLSVALGSPRGPRLSFRVAGAPGGPMRRDNAATAMFRVPSRQPAPPPPSAPPPVSRPLRTQARPSPRSAPQPQPSRPVPARESMTIGRAKTNSVVVEDALASRVHAMVSSTPSGLEIRDNNSSNGTFVNGVLIAGPKLLRDGDVVTIGNTDLLATGNTLVPQPAAARNRGLTAHGLALTIDGRQLLQDVSFSAKPGTLTAVIGPSGAGKSTLVKLVGGALPRSAGLVAFDGHDVHAEYASMRSRIGMVPQDDVVHRQLTVEQALNFAAELRLPPDTTAGDRRGVVSRVLDELELTPHKDTRVDKLSGGQRKRASVAMELLTGPSLLILDEPTSGLDPALDRQVMTMLRRLADAGRVVIVVTHSLTYVGMCDQVLLLAPGGKTAFADPPGQIGSVMGSTDWADIFARVSTDPDGAHRAYLTRHPPSPRGPSPTAGAAPLGQPPRTSSWRQVLTLVRRQTRLITADRGYFAFLAVLPFVLGVLSLAVPGNTGLGQAGATEEPIDILILLNIGAVFLGTALTVRDLVGERMIFQRERAVGLSASAYLFAKVIVYSIAALIGTAVMVAIMTIGKGTPSHGGALLGHGVAQSVLELYLGLALTAITSAMVGLTLSSLARSTEQVLPMLVVTIMVSMVLAGGLIPVTGRLVLDQLAWFVPARWGFAASASTVDLNAVEVGLPMDRLWRHVSGAWLQDIGMLAALGVVLAGLVRYRLRLGKRAR
ncbi:ATP-binding cassette domain-containing protein [Mycobacterium paraterrae]|uniref:ATP-binding cassette domain-containing protein n=1 Tax=Mycobacterium paraterrae TaxID=577492 RepID=A0ABY3VNR9_9MYCO|nr:ATP-binding cassette domain-containing protein [Mycobacterium paraterrae]UMB69143.1 ATP-binding cassette domain-containing protein [Mycobacterium paraterrae]